MIDPRTLRRGDMVRVVGDLVTARGGNIPSMGKIEMQGRIVTIDKVEPIGYTGFKTAFTHKVTLEEDRQFWWFGEELEIEDFDINESSLAGLLDEM